MNLILPVNADAGVIKFVTGGNSGTLSIVGLVTTETVAIQVPRVESPDEANDAHWTPLMQNDAAVVLRAGHNAENTPCNLLVRLVKDAGVAGNAYGVQWS